MEVNAESHARADSHKGSTRHNSAGVADDGQAGSTISAARYQDGEPRRIDVRDFAKIHGQDLATWEFQAPQE